MTRRVFVTGLWHETNTFAATATDLAAFRAYQLFEGAAMADALKASRTSVWRTILPPAAPPDVGADRRVAHATLVAHHPVDVDLGRGGIGGANSSASLRRYRLPRHGGQGCARHITYERLAPSFSSSNAMSATEKTLTA